MLGRILLGNHLVGARLVLHRAGDGEQRGVVVVLENLLVIGGFPVDEHAADDAQLFGLILGDHTFGDRVGDRFGDAIEVTEGLEPGTLIATTQLSKIQQGSRVAVGKEK